MANPAGETSDGVLRVDFDRRLMVEFRGSVVTSDAGLLAYREVDDALRLSELAREMLSDSRTGKNRRHALVGLLRQSVFGRLAGYEDVNDAERLRHDPAMRWIAGGKAAKAARPHPAKWGVSKRSALQRLEISACWPIFPVTGSIAFAAIGQRKRSCWTWIRA